MGWDRRIGNGLKKCTQVRNRAYKGNIPFHAHEIHDQIISRGVSTDLPCFFLFVFVTNKASRYTCPLFHLVCVFCGVFRV